VPQVVHQEGVELDGDHAGRALQEFLGEGAAAGTDFDNQVHRLLGRQARRCAPVWNPE
jgi:hypothetical protein